MIERKIIIGLITSTEYLQQLKRMWNGQLLESSAAKRLASWVWEYFDKYNKAPGKDIEGIYYSKLREQNLPKDVAEEIEEEILPGLSEEYENEGFNLNYLLDQTSEYFMERALAILAENIEALIAAGKIEEASEMALKYVPLTQGSTADLDLSQPVALDRIDKAFDPNIQNIISFPKQLGEFWNDQLVRGALVALMASEKRGKTFWLLEFSMRAHSQKRNVAFFQAGDMTEDQQLKRMCVYLAKKSNLQKFCGKQWQPVRDCIHNQTNDCDKDVRECDFGIFEGKSKQEIRNEIQLKHLVEAQKKNPDYVPCYNCKEYYKNHWGAVWIEEVDVGNALTAKEAKEVVQKFFIDAKRGFKLSSHANGTLSVSNIRAILADWEKQDGFVPDVIVVDYADLLAAETKTEFRHTQNEIWKGLRSLSQEKHCLVITATQADAASYESNRLRLSNFSEDKRKYAHVTAMYGLNQDTKDREKKIGLMRINEIVKREGDFSNSNEVTILQNLKRGRPFLGSYW